MRNLKKISALLVAFSLVFTVIAFAAPNIQTMSDDGDIFVSSYSYDFNINTGLLTYSASVTGVAGVDSTYVATVIQRLAAGGWTDVPGSFKSKTSSTNYAMAGNKQYVTKGYWYRTQNTYVATKNGVQTRDVLNSETKWYN